jgi:hypothetical protein
MRKAPLESLRELQWTRVADRLRSESLRVQRHRPRQSGKTLGSFDGNGRYAGQLHWINGIGMDSKGNIYTGEVEQPKRIQKFAPVMARR